MSPEHAAEMYAEEDVDGTIDRSYDAPGHEILVRDPEGILYTVRVTVEYEASFTGELVTAATE
jgi:hypothetical protein